MIRSSYKIEDILKEITGSPDGVGQDISLSKIYDDIKDARFEEDDRLSQGIWERDLKKADWNAVEKLSSDALIDQSKDLQIIAWLIESLSILDGFEGIAKGIEILTSFIESFWNFCYPRDEENLSDNEQKFRILDWIFETIGKKSIFIPFVSYGDSQINLYNYDYAIEMKSISIRSPNSANEILESAKKNNIKTIEEIQNIIIASDKNDVQKFLKNIEDIKDAKNNLEITIAKISSQKNIKVFSSLLNNLEKIEKILNPVASKKETEVTEKNNSEIFQNISEINTRDKIYDEISELAKKLEILEKHSPSHCMLELIVSWRDKNLLEIINDLKNGNSESHQLLKILMS